jgi:peptidyl-prolyl cis-trans isomerase D
MLQNIRKNLQGNIAKVIIAIIVVPFALVGIESLLSGGGVQYVAEINGEKVSAVELQQQVNQQKRRLMMAMGDDIDPSMLDDQLLAGPALEFIIQKALLLQASRDYGMAVSDTVVGSFIGEMEAFNTDGTFDEALFRRVVSDQGYTPAGFYQALREDMVMTQLRSGLAGSSFATPVEVKTLASINEEQRDLRYLVLPLDKFRSDAEVTDAEVEAWYQAHGEDFMAEETVTLAYIELQRADFNDPVDEQLLRETYEAEKGTWERPEERRVSHILVTPAEAESEEQLQARVAAVQARLPDTGFAELAAELSDDVGSANLGGDLGYTDGSFFPQEMEDVIAELDVDEVSKPVQTDAGWHFIKLTALRGGSSVSFEEMRPELEARLQRDEASKALVKTVEDLRDLVFNAEDLAGPAGELGLEVSRSDPVSRNQSEGLFANPRLIAAAFSQDALEEGYNSDVIEVDNEHFVVLRVVEHKLPELRPLAEVSESITARLRNEAARESIREVADTLLGRLRSGATIEELALERGYQWQVELASTRNNPALSASLVKRAFELPLPAEGETTFEYIQGPEGDIEVFELVEVVPGNAGNLAEGQRQLLERQLVNEYGQQDDQHFQQQLREQADIIRSS